MGKTVGELFLLGGWVMWPLLIFSVVTWAVIIERAYVLLRLRPKLARLTDAVMQSLSNGDKNAARQLCMTEPGSISTMFLATLDNKRGPEFAERSSERNRAKLMTSLKKHLWLLGTIGSASPFLGLLGTVIGILKAFHNMGKTGSGGLTVVGAEISEALIATAFGLIVAIVALLSYNVLVTTANQLLLGLKISLDEIHEKAFETETGKANA